MGEVTDRKTKKTIVGAVQSEAARDGRRIWRVDGELLRSMHLILAHGAGAGMDSAVLTRVAEDLDTAGVTVHRFEFPYMASRRQSAARRPPPRAESLIGDYRQAIGEVRARIGARARLYAGGKSMGGRIACLAAQEAGDSLSGVVVLGFPLSPPGKPMVSRAAVIEGINLPTLIVQGTRDPFGGREAFDQLVLPRCVRVHWIEDGDHDLKPRRSSGSTPLAALDEATRAIAAFCL